MKACGLRGGGAFFVGGAGALFGGEAGGAGFFGALVGLLGGVFSGGEVLLQEIDLGAEGGGGVFGGVTGTPLQF